MPHTKHSYFCCVESVFGWPNTKGPVVAAAPKAKGAFDWAGALPKPVEPNPLPAAGVVVDVVEEGAGAPNMNIPALFVGAENWNTGLLDASGFTVPAVEVADGPGWPYTKEFAGPSVFGAEVVAVEVLGWPKTNVGFAVLLPVCVAPEDDVAAEGCAKPKAVEAAAGNENGGFGGSPAGVVVLLPKNDVVFGSPAGVVVALPKTEVVLGPLAGVLGLPNIELDVPAFVIVFPPKTEVVLGSPAGVVEPNDIVTLFPLDVAGTFPNSDAFGGSPRGVVVTPKENFGWPAGVIVLVAPKAGTAFGSPAGIVLAALLPNPYAGFGVDILSCGAVSLGGVISIAESLPVFDGVEDPVAVMVDGALKLNDKGWLEGATGLNGNAGFAGSDEVVVAAAAAAGTAGLAVKPKSNLGAPVDVAGAAGPVAFVVEAAVVEAVEGGLLNMDIGVVDGAAASAVGLPADVLLAPEPCTGGANPPNLASNDGPAAGLSSDFVSAVVKACAEVGPKGNVDCWG